MARTVDDQIDEAIESLHPRPKFVLTDTSAWVEPFEARLPFRLPPSFRSLIRRYRFPPFERGEVRLFGNVNGRQHDDLSVQVFRDAVLASVTQRGGFVQIGRLSTFSYDPVCFDLRARTSIGEAPLVRLDHEEILINGKIEIIAKVDDSFLALLLGKMSTL